MYTYSRQSHRTDTSLRIKFKVLKIFLYTLQSPCLASKCITSFASFEHEALESPHWKIHHHYLVYPTNA